MTRRSATAVELRIVLPKDLAAAAEERARLAGITIEQLVAIAVELECGTGKPDEPASEAIEE